MWKEPRFGFLMLGGKRWFGESVGKLGENLPRFFVRFFGGLFSCSLLSLIHIGQADWLGVRVLGVCYKHQGRWWALVTLQTHEGGMLYQAFLQHNSPSLILVSIQNYSVGRIFYKIDMNIVFIIYSISWLMLSDEQMTGYPAPSCPEGPDGVAFRGVEPSLNRNRHIRSFSKRETRRNVM